MEEKKRRQAAQETKTQHFFSLFPSQPPTNATHPPFIGVFLLFGITCATVPNDDVCRRAPPVAHRKLHPTTPWRWRSTLVTQGLSQSSSARVHIIKNRGFIEICRKTLRFIRKTGKEGKKEREKERDEPLTNCTKYITHPFPNIKCSPGLPVSSLPPNTNVSITLAEINN